MKTLYLIRHAKSSWNHANLDDFDRPLNERGKADAPFMAKALKDKGTVIDSIVSSPAKRALTTARTFAQTFQLESDKLSTNHALYLPTTHQILEVVNGFKDELESVAIFGHNPGFSDFLDYVTGSGIDMPTCAIAAIQLNVDSWREVSNSNGELVFFEFPKNIR